MSLRAVFALVIVCLVGTSACSHGAPVRNPDPIAAAVNEEATEVAILEALPKRKWTAEEVTPGRIVAFLPVKGFLVRAEILYNAQSVQVRYLSSDNLGERVGSDGQVYAHPNVSKWLRNLALTIARGLGQTAPDVVVETHEAPSAGGEASGTEASAVEPPPALGSAL